MNKLCLMAISALLVYSQNGGKAPSGPVPSAFTEYGMMPLRFADSEVPARTTSQVFTLRFPPAPPASLQLFRNGLLQTANRDYTLSGNRIALVMPAAADAFVAWYRY